MMKFTALLVAFALFSVVFATEYTTKDLMHDTLAQADIEMKDFGFVSGNAFIKYEQKSTNQSAEIHAASIMALAVLADSYPEANYVFAYTLIGGKPVLVTFAKAADVNAFSNEIMSAKEFSTRVGSRVLAMETAAPKPEPINCNLSLFVLGISFVAVLFRN